MNRSTLVKLGALGTALYFANKNKSANANNRNNRSNSPTVIDADNDKNRSDDRSDKGSSPFMYGKQLAEKLLGRKF